MTRSNKISKLANAIRAFRGMNYTSAGKVVWKHHPQPHALNRVFDWLVKLGMNVPASIETIKGFKSTDEMREWLKHV